MLMYTLECVWNCKENTQIIFAEYTETFLKELAAARLRVSDCEQRMAHMNVELAVGEEKVVNLQRALEGSNEDPNQLPEVLLRPANLFKDDEKDTEFI